MNEVNKLLKTSYILNIISTIIYSIYLLIDIALFILYPRIVSTLEYETLKELLLEEGSILKVFLLLLLLIITVPFLTYYIYYLIMDKRKYMEVVELNRETSLSILLECILFASALLATILGYFIVFNTLGITNIFIILFVVITLLPIYILGLINKIKMIKLVLKKFSEV